MSATKPREHGRLLAAVCSATLAAAMLIPAGADAARPLDIGFTDSLFEGANGSIFTKQAAAAGANEIRVNVSWRQIAPTKPADPDNPADPAYNWANTDNASRNAGAAGVDVLLTTFWAPDWAEGPNRPSSLIAPPGSWQPNSVAFGAFAKALATRYSGNYPDPANPGATLPRIQLYEAWNEPNLSTYITPQWNGKQNESAGTYAKLLNAFYEGIKSVSPGATVVTAGTAPFGDDPGKGRRTRPLYFWREMFCLKGNLKNDNKCNATKPKFDILAHHTINVTSPPTQLPDDSDDLVIANFSELTKTLRAAERFGNVGTGGKHPLFANEVWWESNPPEKKAGVPIRTHANYMQQALYLLWKQGARSVYFLQLRDSKYNPKASSLVGYQTGIFTFNGKKKPAYQAVRFPFVTERKSSSRVTAWGRSPATGKVTIEVKKGGGFKKIATVNAKKGGTFTTDLKLTGKAELRAKVAGNTSLVWKAGP